MSTDRVHRRLAAILAADVEGYSRHMAADEVGTLKALRASRAVIDPTLADYGGRVFNTAGDSVIAEFGSAVDAVECAVALQRRLAELNAGGAEGGRLRFRMGIHLGDVLVDGDNLYGDGVNIAARLEATAEAGGICISRAVRDQIRGKIEVLLEDLGEVSVKNIDRPVRCFRVGTEGAPAAEAARRAAPSLPAKPSIAVLPFTNMSGDPEQEFFADGISEDIITALCRLQWLFVIARNSTFTYKGRAMEMKQIGRELGVRYILEGSVRKAGSRVRVTAQLIEAENGTHVWAERYDRAIEDVFALQDEITDTIASTLEPQITAAERDRARRKAPAHLGSWELFQRGMWHLLRRNRDDFGEARRCFARASALDPHFATPVAAGAVVSFFEITHNYTEDAQATRDGLLLEARRSVAIDDRDALAHTALGLAYMEHDDLDKAVAEHDVALQLAPNSSFAHWSCGYALLKAGKAEKALNEFSVSLRLNPRDPAAWSYLTLKASALFQLGRFEEAAVAAADAVRHPTADSIYPYIHLAASLGRLGRIAEAASAVAELHRRGITLARLRDWPHWRGHDRQRKENLLESLRRAGLTEGG